MRGPTSSTEAYMEQESQLLIIGAGPFGLALAAQVTGDGIDCEIVGRPMDFWRANMPAGMYLRSDADWHYDAADVHTIERFLEEANLPPEAADPFPIGLYLEYAEWFRVQKRLEPQPRSVECLDYDAERHRFIASLDDGSTLMARNAVVALGAGYFSHVPPELAALLPPGRYAHTRDMVEFSELAGRRVLIVGGRQSAFEWAALIQESGAECVYLSYRHQTPSFEHAHWDWVADLVRSIGSDPAWYRRLTADEKEKLSARMFAEGRLKLEPWLSPRIPPDKVKQFPGTVITGCVATNADRLEVTLSDDSRLDVHNVVLATGYKPDVVRIPFLAKGSVFARLATRDGFPALDERMQSSVPGLYFTSACAIGDFGPFFGFTVAVRASARLIGNAIRQRLRESRGREEVPGAA